jgi:hypothetical protein
MWQVTRGFLDRESTSTADPRLCSYQEHHTSARAALRAWMTLRSTASVRLCARSRRRRASSICNWSGLPQPAGDVRRHLPRRAHGGPPLLQLAQARQHYRSRRFGTLVGHYMQFADAPIRGRLTRGLPNRESSRDHSRARQFQELPSCDWAIVTCVVLRLRLVKSEVNRCAARPATGGLVCP